MRARHVDKILGPQPLHREEALLESPRPLFPRQASRLCQKRDLLQRLQRVSAVMRAFDQRIEAELLGPHDEVDVIRETGAHVFTLTMLATNDQAQFHSPPPFSGTPDIVFRPPTMQARSSRTPGRRTRWRPSRC